MTQLLGGQDCIESLRRDLVDVQGAILDVFSRTGPVRVSSWKFPDKLSCNLDMFALLEQYDFVDGEDAFNQHSHVILLELIIDRLLLLLQSLNAYVEQLRSSHRVERPQLQGSLSVGLIVRSYWTNLVQFVNFKENCRGNRQQTKTPPPMSPQMTDLCIPCLPAQCSAGSLKSCPQNKVSLSSPHSVPCYPVVSSYNVGSQTVQSSLTPCDACHQVQSILRQTGDALVALFQSESLPSSLKHLLVAVEDTVEMGKMTAGDVAQWANEQLRDMRRLAKHLQDVRGTVQPLKEKLSTVETERERFRAQLAQTQKEFKQELEKHQTNIVQLEFALRKAERALTETNQRLQEEQQQLRREIVSLEESNSRLEEKVALQQDTLKACECENNVLQEKVKTLQIEEEACCKLRQRLQQLESQTSDTQLLLDKENAKYQSACRQQESLHAKQRSLIKRVDTLDEECEELQRQLGEKEEQQNNLHNQLQQMKEEKERLQVQLTQQQDLCLEAQRKEEKLEVHVEELKKSVAELERNLRSSQEREKLLVAFPGLSPVAPAQPQTGNVFLDMKKQLHANSIRIEVLTRENVTLRRSLDKLEERQRHNTNVDITRQLAWGASPSSPLGEKQFNPEASVQTSQTQSSSAVQLAHSNRGKEASRGESYLASARSRDRVSASPPSLKIHLQSLHLNVDSAAAQRSTKKRNTFLLSHPGGSNRIKQNPF